MSLLPTPTCFAGGQGLNYTDVLIHSQCTGPNLIKFLLSTTTNALSMSSDISKGFDAVIVAFFILTI
jgi:hypothetical protein